MKKISFLLMVLFTAAACVSRKSDFSNAVRSITVVDLQKWFIDCPFPWGRFYPLYTIFQVLT